MNAMKCGFVLPKGDARMAADLAHAAEKAGWDGFFVWEPIWGVDAWVCLSAAAMVTSRIRLGTMLSPLSRMRPWDLAAKAAAVDNLSGGRVILSVGLGAVDTGFAEFGEVTDRKTRAELLDEGLDILFGLWKGQPFFYNGKHYTLRETKFYPPPPPLQQARRPGEARIPVWVVGVWPKMKSMRRVARCDGLIPSSADAEGRMGQSDPDALRAMVAWLRENRADASPCDVVVEGTTPGDAALEAAERVRPYAEAGATWWIEAMWDVMDQPDCAERLLARIRQGPPRDPENRSQA
jgi:alkanesulfonate monooxygenase SsuD/methylene tetrahydromethanopterin reductase-like flavin-dependent oxidoreductase (luciferase family)